MVRQVTAKGRFARAVAAVNDWCREHRHWSIRDQHRHLSSMMRGHFAYYGVGGNSRRLRWFANQVVRVWRKWLSPVRGGDGNIPTYSATAAPRCRRARPGPHRKYNSCALIADGKFLGGRTRRSRLPPVAYASQAASANSVNRTFRQILRQRPKRHPLAGRGTGARWTVTAFASTSGGSRRKRNFLAGRRGCLLRWFLF